MITRILAPVDGCEQSEAIIPHVAELCNRTGSPAVLLHVFPPQLHEQRPVHEQYVAHLAEKLRQPRNCGFRCEGGHRTNRSSPSQSDQQRPLDNRPNGRQGDSRDLQASAAGATHGNR
jgi:hypothetical protein